MVKKILVIYDPHLEDEISIPYKLVTRKFLPVYKPDEIILGGDFMSCTSLSHWMENMALEMEGKRYQKELDCAKREIKFLSERTGKITWLEGNHENWVLQYVSRYPALQGMMSIDRNIDFKKYNVKWVPMNDLYRIGKHAHLYFTHGMYINKYHAKTHMERLGCNIVYGHTHNAQTFQMNMRMQDPYMAYGIGCLCDMNQPYLKKRYPNWIHQFAIVEYTDTMFNVIPINIINNKFVYCGKEYKL